MIHDLAHALAHWSAKHGGRYPAAVRVAPWVSERVDDDAKEMSLERHPPGLGITKIMGVEVIKDENVFFAVIDP